MSTNPLKHSVTSCWQIKQPKTNLHFINSICWLLSPKSFILTQSATCFNAFLQKRVRMKQNCFNLFASMQTTLRCTRLSNSLIALRRSSLVFLFYLISVWLLVCCHPAWLIIYTFIVKPFTLLLQPGVLQPIRMQYSVLSWCNVTVK